MMFLLLAPVFAVALLGTTLPRCLAFGVVPFIRFSSSTIQKSRSSFHISMLLLRQKRKQTVALGTHVNGGNGGDPNNDPKNWFADTSPFVALRWFAPELKTDDEIRNFLNENSIATLQKLRQLTSSRINEFLGEGADTFAFCAAVLNALVTLSRPRKTAEQIFLKSFLTTRACHRNATIYTPLGPFPSTLFSFLTKRMKRRSDNLISRWSWGQVDQAKRFLPFDAFPNYCFKRTKRITFASTL